MSLMEEYAAARAKRQLPTFPFSYVRKTLPKEATVTTDMMTRVYTRTLERESRRRIYRIEDFVIAGNILALIALVVWKLL